jgi:PTS system galactitol-specific IIC component
VIFTAIILYCATYAAPIVTQLAAQVGYQLPADTEMVTSLAVGSQWYTWIIYALFKAIGGIF